MTTRNPDLPCYAAHVAEVVIHLRDEGHVLSSIDQHLIERWWDAGYPLDVVLRAVQTGGERLKNRKKPPRGLPLTSLRRVVEKAAERSAAQRVGQDVDDPDPEPGVAEHPAVAHLQAALAERSDAPAAAARLALSELAELGPGAVFSQLLGVGRTYYQAAWDGLTPTARAEHEAAVRADLGPALRSMDPGAAQDTVDELSRRRLRAVDPTFDPARYWSEP